MTGSDYERELYDLIDDLPDWKVLRVAGSGIMANTDLLAGTKKLQPIAIEVKKKNNDRVYISKDQMSRFKEFAEVFGAEPLTALRFARPGRKKEWLIVEPDKFRETKKSWTIHRDRAKKVGLKLGEVFK